MSTNASARLSQLVRPWVALTCIVAAVCVAIPALASDDPSSNRARQLIEEMERLYRADSSQARLSMRVETPHYQRTMTMESSSLGKDKAFIRILSPRKDEGIATLKIGTEMWNYFPKINKVIKVPPSMMMGSWMGSDFTNDDLVKESTLVDEYALELTEDQELYTIVLRPREKTVTVWGRIEYVIDKRHMVPVRQVFFDDDGVQVRVLTYSEPRQFDGLLLPSVMEMVPVKQEGHRTVVTYEALKLNVKDMSAETFTLRNLQQRFK